MALSTYADLKTAVAAWLSVSATDLSSQIDNLITIAEERIFREVRNRTMETALNGTMANGVLALPSDYVALRYAYLDTAPNQALERRPAEWIYANYPYQTASGVPKYIGRNASNFIFAPYPDSQYTVLGVYYARLASVSTTPNALFLANPDIYLMACLAEGGLLIGRDDRIPMWEAKYQRILADVNGVDKTEDQSGSALQMRVGTHITGMGNTNWR